METTIENRRAAAAEQTNHIRTALQTYAEEHADGDGVPSKAAISAFVELDTLRAKAARLDSVEAIMAAFADKKDFSKRSKVNVTTAIREVLDGK